MPLNVPQVWTLDPAELLSPLHKHLTASNKSHCCSSLQGGIILCILDEFEQRRSKPRSNFSVSCVPMLNFGEPVVAVLYNPQGAQLIFVCRLKDLQSLGAVRDELLPIYTWGCIWIHGIAVLW